MVSNPTIERSHTTTQSLVILVADDASDVQNSIRGWLRELGHEVHCVSSGRDAIRLVEQHAVDLVITEVILPNGDGLEVITALRKAQPNARILAFSGGGRYLTGAECLRVAKGLGAHQVLLKPATRDEVLSAIAETMAGVVEFRPQSAPPFASR